MPNTNAKGDLIARLVSAGSGAPVFEAESTGPAHERMFSASVSVDGRFLGRGEGRTKREAERAAAEAALVALDAPLPAEADEIEGERWPIYAQVLAQSVEAAIEFADEDAALEDVQRDAARFYKGLLSDLGHDPEEG